MRAYLYCRFSTLEQSRGSSLERQLRDCRDMCDRMGWDRSEARELIDEGRSAYDGSNRTGDSAMAAFERAACAGDIPPDSVLVVERLDRLSRQSPSAVFRLINSLLEAGIAIATVSSGRVLSGEMRFDQLIDMIVTAKLANEESEKKSERLKAAWIRKRRLAGEGVPLTARCPAWIEKRATEYRLIDERADVVRRIYEMAAAGQGKHLIAATLNKEQTPTFGGRSAGWHPSYVQKLLATRAVLGEFQLHRTQGGKRVPDGEPLIGFFPAIVDEELFARAQAARSVRSSMAGRRGPRIANLFSGLVKCAGCGATMTYRDKGNPGEQYLVCDSALRRRGCDSRTYLKYSVIEDSILDELLALAMDDRQLAVSGTVAALLRDQAEAAAAIASLESRRARLIDLLSRGEDPDVEKMFRDLGVELADRRRAAELVQKRLVEARGAVPTDVHLSRVQDARAAIASDDPATRLAARAMAQQAIRHIVDKILCDGAAEHVTVVALGGVHVFRFSRAGELLGRASDLDQLAGRPGEVAAHFGGGDGGRDRELIDVAPRVGKAARGRGLKERELAESLQKALGRQRALYYGRSMTQRAASPWSAEPGGNQAPKSC